MDIFKLKANPKNPRFIRDVNFRKLLKSLEDAPWMMEARPIVIDESGLILGGNMRFEALLRLGYEEVPDNWVRMLRGLTDEQKAEFVIKDNANFGEWDYDVLANEWDSFPLSDWTVEIPDFDSERSYTEPPADGDGADVGGGTDAAGAIVVCPSCGHCFARGEEGGKD